MTHEQAGSATPPLVSVVVSTRNRPDDAALCVATILGNQSPQLYTDLRSPFATDGSIDPRVPDRPAIPK